MPLNILVVVEKNSWLDFHIADSFEELGHKVVRFNFGEYISEFYGMSRANERLKKNKELLETAHALQKNSSLDFIFCYVYDDFLLPEYAKALEALAIPIVNYNVDMPSQWYRQIKTAKFFTCILCAQPDHMNTIGQYAKKTLYFPMAAKIPHMSENNSFKKPVLPVTFLGTCLPYRRHLLSELIRASIPLEIYGKNWKESISEHHIRSIEKTCTDLIYYGWPRIKSEGVGSLFRALMSRFKLGEAIDLCIPDDVLHGPVLNEEILLLFKSSKINLGLTRYAGDDLNRQGRCQMKLRDFEVPMAGGFYLVEKSPGYELAFEDGREIVTWTTLPDLKEKINYYLAHEEEREQIAKAGQLRAIQEHSWASRFDMLFAELDIKQAPIKKEVPAIKNES